MQASCGQALDVLPAQVGRALPGIAMVVHMPRNVFLDRSERSAAQCELHAR